MFLKYSKYRKLFPIRDDKPSILDILENWDK